MTKPVALIFSKNLERLRKAKGLTQSELSEAIDVSLRAQQRYEVGDRIPNTDIIDRIIKVLDVSSSDLFVDKEETPPPQEQSESISNTISLMTENMKRLQEAFGHVPDDIIELLSLIDNEKAWKSAKLYLTGAVELDTKNSVPKKEEKKEIG